MAIKLHKYLSDLDAILDCLVTLVTTNPYLPWVRSSWSRNRLFGSYLYTGWSTNFDHLEYPRYFWTHGKTLFKKVVPFVSFDAVSAVNVVRGYNLTKPRLVLQHHDPRIVVLFLCLSSNDLASKIVEIFERFSYTSWPKYRLSFKKIEMTLTSPRIVHLQNSYYWHITIPFVPYNFCE